MEVGDTERGRETKAERGREREREKLLLASCNTDRWSYYSENLTTFFFSLFYPGVPGTLSCYYDQNTWTAHRLPTLTFGGKEKQMCRSKVQQPLFLSGISPNWRSCETPNGRLGTRFQPTGTLILWQHSPAFVLGLANDSHEAAITWEIRLSVIKKIELYKQFKWIRKTAMVTYHEFKFAHFP